MTFVVDRALQILERARLALGPGLTVDQLAELQHTYGFSFNVDHAALLRQTTPEGWLDWLGDESVVRDRLAWPIEGILFDVEQNAFWIPEWGERPPRKPEAIDLARERLRSVPALVPLTGHRYLPAAPIPSGAPVLSAYQTDVIYYGTDLADYCAYEYLGERANRGPVARVPFWSDLIDGAGGVQLW